jgi:hypothetical protein
MRRASLIAGLLGLLGCAESFEPASLVQDLRPVAALVEVEGDPSRANPDPGDVIRVTQHIIDAGPKPEIEWRFVACVPAPSVITPPICGSVIEPCDDCVNEDGPRAEDPVIRFQVPGPDELGDETEVVVQGAICQGEIASEERLLELLFGRVEEINPCVDPENEGRLISVRIPIEQYDPPNLQPEIVSLQIGCPQAQPECTAPDRWLDLPAGTKTGCLDDIPGDELQKCIPSTVGVANIRLSVRSESLQAYTNEDGDDFQEEIQISWLADDGDFERSFSFIDSESLKDVDSNPFESVSWGLPSNPASDGTYVRFSFVIRDGRGGTAWVEHGLCVVPPEVWEAECR